MANKVHEGPHKYQREIFKQSGTRIYRCKVRSCPHFLYEQFIIGRISLCHRCGESFEVVNKTLRAKKFHCEDCTRGKYNKVIERPTIESADAVLGSSPLKVEGSFGDLEKILEMINEKVDEQNKGSERKEVTE